MAKGPELLLKPTHGLIEERRGFLRESAALPVQLRAQPAKRASSARKLLPVPMNGVHKSKQPLLRRTQAVPLRPGCAKLLEAPLHHGFGEFFLGFEVVVDIAYRHAGRLGDVRQTRLSETASIRQLRRSLNQSLSLVRLCRAHILRLGAVSYLTNSAPAYMMFNSAMWIQVFSTDRKWSRARNLVHEMIPCRRDWTELTVALVRCLVLESMSFRQPPESIRCETVGSRIVCSVRIGPPQPKNTEDQQVPNSPLERSRYTEVITNPMTLDLARRLRCESDQLQPKGQD